MCIYLYIYIHTLNIYIYIYYNIIYIIYIIYIILYIYIYWIESQFAMAHFENEGVSYHVDGCDHGMEWRTWVYSKIGGIEHGKSS